LDNAPPPPPLTPPFFSGRPEIPSFPSPPARHTGNLTTRKTPSSAPFLLLVMLMDDPFSVAMEGQSRLARAPLFRHSGKKPTVRLLRCIVTWPAPFLSSESTEGPRGRLLCLLDQATVQIYVVPPPLLSKASSFEATVLDSLRQFLQTLSSRFRGTENSYLLLLFLRRSPTPPLRTGR